MTVVPGRPIRAWASVLLPDPFGPMMTCTSPPSTVRSTPCSTSRPATDACRPSTTKFMAAPPRPRRRRPPPRTRRWLRGRQRARIAGEQIEGAPVPRALDLALVDPHLAFGQRVVLVAATVGHGVERVPDAHQGDAVAGHVEAPGLARTPARRPGTASRSQARAASGIGAGVARRQRRGARAPLAAAAASPPGWARGR